MGRRDGIVSNTIQTLSDRIHDVLRERLVNHDIPPGEPIRQDAFAAEFGMSKIPVREALTRLEANGLVISTPHKGYLAAPLTLEEAEELFTLRRLFEPATTALAATVANADQRADVRRRLESLEEAPQNMKRTADERLELLEALMAPARRPTSLALMRHLFFRTERYVHRAPESGALDIQQVHSLLKAWLSGDRSKVETLYRSRLDARWSAARVNAAP